MKPDKDNKKDKKIIIKICKKLTMCLEKKLHIKRIMHQNDAKDIKNLLIYFLLKYN